MPDVDDEEPPQTLYLVWTGDSWAVTYAKSGRYSVLVPGDKYMEYHELQREYETSLEGLWGKPPQELADKW